MPEMKYLTILAWFCCCCSLFLESECQANANGTSTATPLMQKTSFSCAGRPAGYYADIETGCQIYHMCDGLGRQFSYTCPNTTLFQQRMLICDHWYMVNCSKAESDYAANLLIGQRDKPFVNDEENNLRTPRPDLLDRPYAPDYSGDSFRSQYKQLTPVQNQIRDEANKASNKQQAQPQSQPQQQAGQTRWRIPPPSRIILPPAYEPQILFSSSSTEQPKPLPTTTRRAVTTARTTTAAPRLAVLNEALHSRKPTVYVANPVEDADDLGTSHSTRYNTSADFNSAEAAAPPAKSAFSKTVGSTKQPIKMPSKIYEPPFLYPIYNQDEQPLVTAAVYTSTAAPFSTASTRLPAVSSTTARAISRPTTYAGLPFSTLPTTSTTSSATRIQPQSARPAAGPVRTENRTPTPAQSFRLASPTSSPNALNRLPKPLVPHTELLPPFIDFVPHDIATTQGPPIYYEWKVPSNGLEPPKSDPPIGVDGREYPETTNDYNSAKSVANTKLNDIASGPLAVNQASSTAATKNYGHARAPTVRSIKSDVSIQSATEKAQRRVDFVAAAAPVSTDLTQLRKELLIPEYAFPLETIGRTGYAAGDVYNSFQLKIPERHGSSSKSHKYHWFGENPKCPECHPSFVIPGTCEPCLQR